MLTLRVRAIVDVVVPKNVVAPIVFDNECWVPVISLEALASQSVELFCPGRQVG